MEHALFWCARTRTAKELYVSLVPGGFNFFRSTHWLSSYFSWKYFARLIAQQLCGNSRTFPICRFSYSHLCANMCAGSIIHTMSALRALATVGRTRMAMMSGTSRRKMATLPRNAQMYARVAMKLGAFSFMVGRVCHMHTVGQMPQAMVYAVFIRYSMITVFVPRHISHKPCACLLTLESLLTNVPLAAPL